MAAHDILPNLFLKILFWLICYFLGRLIPATPTTQSMVLASPRSQGQSRLPTRSKSPSDLPRSLPVPDTEQGSVRRPLSSNLDSFSWSHSPRKDGPEIPKINCDRPISPTNSKRIDKFTEPNDVSVRELYESDQYLIMIELVYVLEANSIRSN